MRLLLNALLILAAVAALLLWLSRPLPLPDSAFEGLQGDAERGERVFWAAGCASCHSPEGARGDDRLLLSGGRRFESDFGTFVAPNISSDPQYGIGDWTLAEFANAMLRGVSPDGSHYYPSFPYTAYTRMEPGDVADLKAYMDTLPASARASEPHDLGFPFSLRRGVGLWKRRYLVEDWVVTGELTAQEQRGRYLSEALAHCGECHTPRDGLGGLDVSRWLGGAPNPSGSGSIPDITPSALRWSESEIAGYLASGFTPSFDSVGGSMAAVVDALGRLPAEDLAAIAAYLKQVAPTE
jgi:mono/diheme cytochrome c family protein